MEAEGIELQRVEAVRALVQAFEDGASEGVGKKDADKGMGGKRKGTVHFLASVFANISMVSLPPPPLPLCSGCCPSSGAFEVLIDVGAFR